MIVDVLIKKYGDHFPAYRQSMGLQRDAGIDLSRKTLIHAITRSGGLLEALIPGKCRMAGSVTPHSQF